jgi:predicted acetyltransferase
MLDVRPLSDDDADQARRLGELAFGYRDSRPTRPAQPDDPWSRWGAFDSSGRLVGKVTDLHHEQWWGGRVVPASGIAGVAVAPEHRGLGATRGLLTAALRGARERGASVSGLFCTAAAVYRSFGFEVGAELRSVNLPTAVLARAAVPSIHLRAADGTDWPLVRSVYDAVARGSNGLLSRRGRLFPDPDPAELPSGLDGVTLALDESGAALGYVSWQRGDGYRDDSVLTVWDFLALHTDAARALASMLASWETVTPTIRMRLLPWLDAVSASLPLERVREHKVDIWMHRPVDVAAAIAGRGWPLTLEGDVAFRLVDPDLEWNDGAWQLAVTGGEARLEGTHDDPDLCLHVRGWAALWSGVARSAQLRQAGLLVGGDAALDARLDATLGCGGPAGALDYF